MKRFLPVFILLWTVLVFTAAAQTPDEQYLRIYGLMQQADALNQAGQSSQALALYLDAQSSLTRLQKVFPDWSPKVVSFRLQYFEDKIAEITAKTRPAPAPPVTNLQSSFALSARPSAPSDTDRKITQLQGQVDQLQADKTLLESKLKEALATQPATVDPRELAKAEERIQSLLKENDLLKVTLNDKQPATSEAEAKALEEARQALDLARQKLSDQTAKADQLALEREALEKRVAELNRQDSTAELKSTKAALETANTKLSQQTEAANKLAAEKDALQTRVDALATTAAAAEALRAENELLKKQLADLKASTPSTDELAAQKNQLTQAQAGIAALQSEIQVLRLEKTAVEEQLKKANAARESDAKQIQQLQKEQAELQKKLAEKPRRGFLFWRSKGNDTKVKELTAQVDSFRARLDALEAKAVPYSAEELALMQSPPVQIAAASPKTNGASKEPPPGTIPLAAEARRLFAAGQFSQAEQKYLEILKRDPDNVYTLGNLAAIQLEMGKLDDAEKNIQHALKTDPNDAFLLSTLGYLKFRQGKYDDAINALSRAASLDPQNSDIQNYLGVALNHKGLREPAETALRKAIQIDPNNASAQNNLAVFYATQKPPLLGLARWHYNKAIALGHPKNEEVEKLLQTPSSNAAPGTP